MSSHRVRPVVLGTGDVDLRGDPFQAGGQEVLTRGDRPVQPGDRHAHPLGHGGERELRDAEPERSLNHVVAREPGPWARGLAQSCHGPTVMRSQNGCPWFSRASKVHLNQD